MILRSVRDPRTERCGYIDRHGAMVIAPRFVGARRFQYGLATAIDERFYSGYIDTSGSWQIDPVFELAARFAPYKLRNLIKSTSVSPNWIEDGDRYLRRQSAVGAGGRTGCSRDKRRTQAGRVATGCRASNGDGRTGQAERQGSD
mgnify:CR=1 FL=1